MKFIPPPATKEKKSQSVHNPRELKFINSTVSSVQSSILNEQDSSKKRTRASSSQSLQLQAAFRINPLPDTITRKLLAEKLEMTPRAVQVWFQNRRAKVRSLPGGDAILVKLTEAASTGVLNEKLAEELDLILAVSEGKLKNPNESVQDHRELLSLQHQDNSKKVGSIRNEINGSLVGQENKQTQNMASYANNEIRPEMTGKHIHNDPNTYMNYSNIETLDENLYSKEFSDFNNSFSMSDFSSPIVNNMDSFIGADVITLNRRHSISTSNKKVKQEQIDISSYKEDLNDHGTFLFDSRSSLASTDSPQLLYRRHSIAYIPEKRGPQFVYDDIIQNDIPYDGLNERGNKKRSFSMPEVPEKVEPKIQNLNLIVEEDLFSMLQSPEKLCGDISMDRLSSQRTDPGLDASFSFQNSSVLSEADLADYTIDANESIFEPFNFINFGNSL